MLWNWNNTLFKEEPNFENGFRIYIAAQQQNILCERGRDDFFLFNYGGFHLGKSGDTQQKNVHVPI